MDEPTGDGLGVVLRTELRHIWLGWRGPALLLVFSLFLSVYTVLLAANPEMNVLSQQKMLLQTIRAAIVAGMVVVVLLGADTFSGERDRRTLESLLLTPVARSRLAAGKLLAILSLWLGMAPIATPYVVLVARGTGLESAAVVLLWLTGTVLVALCAGISLIISALSPRNLLSISVSVLIIMLLAAPVLLPGSVQDLAAVRWFILANPFTAIANLQTTILDGIAWGEALPQFISPLVALGLVFVAGLRYLDTHLTLGGGLSL